MVFNSCKNRIKFFAMEKLYVRYRDYFYTAFAKAELQQ
ncbi:hypothetical protein DDD_3003 [Nonlabens dokdonensis DSW-6]|uniref:Uncharacterized protein n=1 Tax=Nonlabens dokdonensis (strain DSM 17205 / KCTC 12402 / DSW-6) TaxID=592029 RepID=L7W8U5_NONDD|nr:hypothetical protein DDD_3003 [Nonlabens dokdonensis DSW-6]